MTHIAILKESDSKELRVAATPETVKKFILRGATVTIESNAGDAASFSNEAYEAAGAIVSQNPQKILEKADILLKVSAPFNSGRTKQEFHYLPKNAIVIGMLSPFAHSAKIHTMAESLLTSFSLDLLPRISRAQSMDVLSSQSNIAGYKAALDGMAAMNKATPMMMTAAGTIKPAKVLVIGAGVAGLQAIATAKRMGAIVSAFDVRSTAREQVESLGASFIEVDDKNKDDGQTSAGYAKEMDDSYKKKQAVLLQETLISHDLVITTALIPGKPAPIIITREMVESMKQGSVIVDLAASGGGNCECTHKGATTTYGNVTIIGNDNFPSLLARDASELYSRNIFNFTALLLEKGNENQQSSIIIPKDDDIIKQTLVTHQGRVMLDGLPEKPVVSRKKDNIMPPPQKPSPNHKNGGRKTITAKNPPRSVTSKP